MLRGAKEFDSGKSFTAETVACLENATAGCPVSIRANAAVEVLDDYNCVFLQSKMSPSVHYKTANSAGFL